MIIFGKKKSLIIICHFFNIVINNGLASRRQVNKGSLQKVYIYIDKRMYYPKSLSVFTFPSIFGSVHDRKLTGWEA